MLAWGTMITFYAPYTICPFVRRISNARCEYLLTAISMSKIQKKLKNYLLETNKVLKIELKNVVTFCMENLRLVGIWNPKITFTITTATRYTIFIHTLQFRPDY